METDERSIDHLIRLLFQSHHRPVDQVTSEIKIVFPQCDPNDRILNLVIRDLVAETTSEHCIEYFKALFEAGLDPNIRIETPYRTLLAENQTLSMYQWAHKNFNYQLIDLMLSLPNFDGSKEIISKIDSELAILNSLKEKLVGKLDKKRPNDGDIGGDQKRLCIDLNQ